MNRRGLACVAVIWLGIVLVGCGDDDVTTAPTLVDVPETVAMGVIPQPLSDAPTLPPPPPAPTTEPTSTTTSAAPVPEGPLEGPVGQIVSGDRILLVGDSILASAAPRDGSQLCDALELFGWQAEIDARSDADIDFGSEVLDARLTPEDEDEAGWDVIVLSFGSDVDAADADAVEEFGSALEALVDRVAPRPVLLYTLADEDGGKAAINELIRALPESHPNVLLVEFADAADDGVAVLEDDGRTLTDDGTKRFSIRTAAAIGEAPGDDDGACLPSQYQD